MEIKPFPEIVLTYVFHYADSIFDNTTVHIKNSVQLQDWGQEESIYKPCRFNVLTHVK